MIYEPASDSTTVKYTGSGDFVQILDGTTKHIHAPDGDTLLQCKTVADFAHQECAETKTKKKRVRFEDDVPDGTTSAEATEASTDDLTMQVRWPSADVQHEPTADDIDPVAVQEERRRRIAQA
ncbi:hypothetical protein PHMEG_00013852 [Phytophthora megakarya]|uniref:Uncharacterized protein n=1 Tax=Phytophthora megakarya TaxID=4795 RepID=A0A225W588_9STRA|nr:hypothetical protein PHMEG_00013852 [Phytophthora megakarya]